MKLSIHIRVLILTVVVILIHITLATWSAVTKSPWSDEAWFANAAWNLAYKGKLATTVLETKGTNLQGLEQHTYWVMPLHLLVQAATFKLLGFSLLNLRLISIAFAVLALFSWYIIVERLTERPDVALLTILLLATDYVFVMGSSFGRMDMMSTALGAAGLAAYLVLRTRHLSASVLVSQSFVAASGMTHPNGGVLFLLGTIAAFIYIDRKCFRWTHLIAFVVPYLIGGILWGTYILQAPNLFWAQFVTNGTMGGRMSGLFSPFAAFKNEIVNRYLQSFGLAGHSIGHSGPIRLKALILVAYVVGICGVLMTRQLRRHPGTKVLILLTALFFVVLTIFDGQKLSFYLIHIVPLYTALLSLWVCTAWVSRQAPRVALTVGVGALLVLQIGGVVYRARQDSYHKGYLPAVDFIKQHFPEKATVMGSAVLGFDLDFDRIVDDVRLGFVSGKRSEIIVVGETYEGAFKDYQQNEPQIYQHIVELTTRKYRRIYGTDTYQVYVQNSPELDGLILRRN